VKGGRRFGYGQRTVSQQAIADPFGLVGKTLDGQFRIERVIGEGGFGVVYKAQHLSLGQPVAVKALKIFAEDAKVQETLLARFREEARLLYTLSQSTLQIVRSLDFGGVETASGAWAPYMVLEWLEGRTIAQDLEQRRARGMRGRTLEEALALLEPAAEGLRVAHEHRVAHRDVKPANFFIVNSAGKPNVKVLDFGIAKILREDDKGATKGTLASFTYLYAAPEQLDPRRGATGLATDVYAFALVLTELLTDRPPVDARDVVTLLKTVSDPTVRPTPRVRGGNVPDAVEAVCRRALAVEPSARYQSIGELWTALKDAVDRAKAPSSGDVGSTRRSGSPPFMTPPPGSMPVAQPPSYGAVPAMTHAPSMPQHAPSMPQQTQQPYANPQPMMPYPQSPPRQPMRYWPHPVRRIMPNNGSSSAYVALALAVGIIAFFFAGCGVLLRACAAAGN
jgi:serine/threonine protein kinase